MITPERYHASEPIESILAWQTRIRIGLLRAAGNRSQDRLTGFDF